MPPKEMDHAPLLSHRLILPYSKSIGLGPWAIRHLMIEHVR
jgi:hypothetical protein